MSQQLREAANQVQVEGLFAENRMEIVEVDGMKVIRGEFDVEVAEGEVHTFRVYATEKKKDGTDNNIFKGLKTVMDEYKSIASHGREEADKVRITNGKLGLNEYYAPDGQLKQYTQLTTNFVNRVPANDKFEPKAEFEVELFVHSVTDEIKNNEETGRVILKGYVPLFNGRVIPMQFVVGEEGAEFVKDNYEPGTTVKIFGEIINRVEIKKIEEPVAFGKPKEKITKNIVRELRVTGGKEPYDEESSLVFDPKLIKAALTEREIYLENLKNKKKEEPKQEEKLAFGSKPSKKSSESGFDPNELPF
jgi:hypothetical protein